MFLGCIALLRSRLSARTAPRSERWPALVRSWSRNWFFEGVVVGLRMRRDIFDFSLDFIDFVAVNGMDELM